MITADRAVRHRSPSRSVPGLEWSVHHRLDSCADIWRTLERVARRRVFQTFDWVNAWYQLIGAPDGIAPRVVVGWRDGEPRLLFPLALERRRGVSALVWLAGAWNDYNAPLIACDQVLLATGGNVARLWDEVAELAGPADMIELVKQSPTLDGPAPNALRHPDGVAEDNSAYILDLQPDVEAMFAAMHSAKTWKTYERKRRNLERDGTVGFGRVGDAAEAGALVRRMLAWKSENLATRGATNPFADPRAVAFLATLAERHPDTARVYALSLDDAPVAIALCLVEDDNLILYQTAYDERHGRRSPGALLIHDIIRKAAGERFASFDFSFGDDPYKTQICNRAVALTRAIVPLSAIGRLAVGLAQSEVRLRRWVKGNRSIYLAALRLNRWAS